MLKKILALCLCFILLAASALASDLEVLSERMYVITQDDYPRIYYFRVVRNRGTSNLILPTIELDILDRDGKSMGRDNVYSSRYVLTPNTVCCYAGDYIFSDSLPGFLRQGRYPGSFRVNNSEPEETTYYDDAIYLATSCSYDLNRRDGDDYYIDVCYENDMHATVDMEMAEVYLLDDAGHIILADYDFVSARVPGYQTQSYRFHFDESLMRIVLGNNSGIHGVYGQTYTD